MEVKMLPIDKIRPAPFQPRETFNKEKISELAASIRESDLIEPIVVREHGNTYQIIAGERRWRAWHEIGRKEIPAIIRNVSDDEAMELSLIENWHREDLSPGEKGKMVHHLWGKFGPQGTNKYKSKEELAKKLGIGREAVDDLIRVQPIRVDEGYKDTVSTKILVETAPLSKEERQVIIQQAEKGEISKGTESIQAYVKTVKESSDSVKKAVLEKPRVFTPDIARTIMQVSDQRAQDQIIKKIETEKLDNEDVKKIVEVVKKAPESVREAMLKPKSRITTEIAERIIEFPEREQQRSIIKEIEKAKDLEEKGIKAFVEDRLDIAKGKRAPDITIRDPSKRLVELYNRIYSDVITISADHVNSLPLARKEEAVGYMRKAHDHLERELIKLKELKSIKG